MRINNDFIIVGVDAGYGNMKTANTIFPTGLAAMNTKPYFDGDIMHYNGRWYRIGEGHKAFKPDKTADEDFYILTLASIAAELRTKDITEANIYPARGRQTLWPNGFNRCCLPIWPGTRLGQLPRLQYRLSLKWKPKIKQFTPNTRKPMKLTMISAEA